MPNIKITKSNIIEDTYKNNYVKSKFDIDKIEISENFDINFEFPEKWNLGVIVGSSGTGKSTIANDLFKISSFKYGKGSVIDEMKIDKDISVDEVISLFNKVGFSSPPSWLKPYHVLSNGQKMRVDLAQALLKKNEIICFDEFTSVVDREVAKMASMCISKYVKKEQKQFVAVSCHYDILEWLEPDWILDTSSMTFYKGKMSPNTKDLQSGSISESARETNGENLKSIII